MKIWKKPRKNHGFFKVRALAAMLRSLKKKSQLIHLLIQMQVQCVMHSDMGFWSLWGPLGSYFGGFGDSLGGSWGLMGPVGETLESSGGALGELLAAHGTPLGVFWTLMGSFWELLGVAWALLGRF